MPHGDSERTSREGRDRGEDAVRICPGVRTTRRVAAVLVNYCTPELVLEALQSLEAELGRGHDLRALVVDNASPDGSGARLRSLLEEPRFSRWVVLLELTENRGFGAGNNAAFRLLFDRAPDETPDALLLMNPDTRLRPGALAALVQLLDEQPGAGAVGPQIVWPDSQPQHSAFRFPSIWSELDGALRIGLVSRLLAPFAVPMPIATARRVCDWVSGSCVLLRRELIESVGAFDEGYFLYFEETDLCRRARAAGWEVWQEPAARVEHLVGASTGLVEGDQSARPRPRWWFESRRRYFLRHHGAGYLWLADVLWLVGFASWRLRRRWQGKPDRDPRGFLGDFARFRFSRIF